MGFSPKDRQSIFHTQQGKTAFMARHGSCGHAPADIPIVMELDLFHWDATTWGAKLDGPAVATPELARHVQDCPDHVEDNSPESALACIAMAAGNKVQSLVDALGIKCLDGESSATARTPGIAPGTFPQTAAQKRSTNVKSPPERGIPGFYAVKPASRATPQSQDRRSVGAGQP